MIDLPQEVPDIRLVAVDLDGTLLDAEGALPKGFWQIADEMAARGIVLAPASGRPYATLRQIFGQAADVVFIAENGAHVIRDDREISSDPVGCGLVDAVVRQVRALGEQGLDLGLVLCGTRTAFVERADAAFLAEARRYYANLERVDDLLAVEGEDIVKLAVYDVGSAEVGAGPALREAFGRDSQVVVSGAHWVDLMKLGVDKGRALRRLQAELGVTAAQTVAFGDYLNDLSMLSAADYSFAMAEAHPEVVANARFRAPSHRDGGVVTVLRALL